MYYDKGKEMFLVHYKIKDPNRTGENITEDFNDYIDSDKLTLGAITNFIMEQSEKRGCDTGSVIICGGVSMV